MLLVHDGFAVIVPHSGAFGGGEVDGALGGGDTGAGTKGGGKEGGGRGGGEGETRMRLSVIGAVPIAALMKPLTFSVCATTVCHSKMVCQSCNRSRIRSLRRRPEGWRSSKM